MATKTKKLKPSKKITDFKNALPEPTEPEGVFHKNQFEVRQLINTLYNHQQNRIRAGQRITSALFRKLGLYAGKTKSQLDKKALELLSDLQKSYDSLTDGAASELLAAHLHNKSLKDLTAEDLLTVKRRKSDHPKPKGKVNFPKEDDFIGKDDAYISTYGEFVMATAYFKLLADESDQLNIINTFLKRFPIWTKWLKPHVIGVGPTMAGVLIAYLSPYKAKYPSHFVSYGGIGVEAIVNEDGSVIHEATGNKKSHMRDITYTKNDGTLTHTKRLKYNPILRTKLLGVLGPLFVKTGTKYEKRPALDKNGNVKKDKDKKTVIERTGKVTFTGHYAELYFNYKRRLNHHKLHWKKSDLHKHAMSNRWVLRIFLQDLHKKWRELEGLPIYDTYEEKKLQMYHDTNYFDIFPNTYYKPTEQEIENATAERIRKAKQTKEAKEAKQLAEQKAKSEEIAA